MWDCNVSNINKGAIIDNIAKNNLSDDEEELKEKQTAEKILAAKKRKEEDYRSHLAFLHHEDFMHQLGEDVAREESPPRQEPQDEPVQERFLK